MSFSDPINSYCNVFRKFGMLPFEKRRGLLRPPKILICVHFTVFLACVSLGIFHFSGSHVYQELTQLVVTAFAYSALAIIYVSWFYSIFQVNFIGEFIKIIDVTAPRFIHYTSTFKSSFLLKMIVLHYICFLAASICWILLVPTPLFSIVYILVSTQLIVNTVPFGSFVSLVGDYFDQLHSSLTYSGNSFDTSKTNLRALLVIFDRLCFGIDQLIAYYEYPITSIIAYSFVAVVSEIYYLLFHWGSVFSFFASWSWVSFHSSILLFLIWTCDRVKRKAENFSKQLSSCAFQDRSKQLLTSPYVAMHFASRRKLKFTVCGCFNIDYRLGCSMVAACVTYLVILVQIDQTKNSSAEA